jgi:hypothetical protein
VLPRPRPQITRTDGQSWPRIRDPVVVDEDRTSVVAGKEVMKTLALVTSILENFFDQIALLS